MIAPSPAAPVRSSTPKEDYPQMTQMLADDGKQEAQPAGSS